MPRRSFRLVRIRCRESEKGHDPFAGDGLDVSACFQEGLGRVGDEFSCDLGQLRGRAFLREIVFVGDVANDRGRFIALRFGIEGQLAGGDAGDLFFREATAEKVPRETGASLSAYLV